MERVRLALNRFPRVIGWYGCLRGCAHKYLLPAPRTFDAHPIAPQLYLGSIWAAHHVPELRRRGISHIVSAAAGLFPAYPAEFTYLCLALHDVPNQPLLDAFERTNRFVDEARRGGGAVLLHCMQGKSRSAALAAAYLVHAEGLSLPAALERLQAGAAQSVIANRLPPLLAATTPARA